jgi:hypothetical protein
MLKTNLILPLYNALESQIIVQILGLKTFSQKWDFTPLLL